MKNGLTVPVADIAKLISIEKIKGPYAAIAAVHPMTPAACLGFAPKIIGNCLNVAALPIPVKKNSVSIKVTNIPN